MSEMNDTKMMDYIIHLTREYFAMPNNYYLNRDKRNPMVFARQMAMYLIRKHTKLPLLTIGNKFKMHHSTIIHGIRKIEDFLAVDKKVNNQISTLERILKYQSDDILKMIRDNQDLYFIDLSNCSSVRISDEKYIVMVGMTDFEKKMYAYKLKAEGDIVDHKTSGMYLLETNILKHGNQEKE
jgi:hypothetical protein